MNDPAAVDFLDAGGDGVAVAKELAVGFGEDSPVLSALVGEYLAFGGLIGLL
ncbi:hypothetical protein [Streptomyces sp. CB01373]|uniref:hypothetical protein n=1 Tax=Streptomyces sp. CB01373 TaxID=2020325 RepID=UPI001F1FFF7B|nr:hypothetical protein [Streptomyces sp. CB01373]